MIELKKAEPRDCGAIHAMQVEAFAELLEKYGDTAANPGAEPLEGIEARMAQDATDYYLILAEGRQIGAARVQRLPENVYRVAPIFILPAFQGKGYAQAAVGTPEEMYPQAEAWKLDTIREEAKLCHLYEKLGYRRTGREEILQPGRPSFITRSKIGQNLEKEHE